MDEKLKNFYIYMILLDKNVTLMSEKPNYHANFAW